MSGEITLLVNPAAGRGRGGRAARPAARVLREAGFRVRSVVGQDAPDALRRAEAAVARGPGAVVAVGGDGLVSLALRAVAGTATPLGIVAAGTGNDTARACGLPTRDPGAAASPPTCLSYPSDALAEQESASFRGCTALHKINTWHSHLA